MRVLIAFDKFKDALGAQEACQLAAEALQDQRPDWQIDTAPLADGGDGFCDTLTKVAQGDYHQTRVTGPLEQPADATWGIVSTERIHRDALRRLNLDPNHASRLAVIEMAQSSGIALTPIEGRSPWRATTVGLGELIAAASDHGIETALIGLGGSATHDLALGALHALGFTFLDADNHPLAQPPTPERWPAIASIVPPPGRRWPAIRIACDVENPLLGPEGAAAVFGPQKGLREQDYDRLEELTSRLARLLCQATGKPEDLLDVPGTGAAGGCAFGLMAALDGQIVSGYELVGDWIQLAPKLDQADAVITGEGRFDKSSLQGKGPGQLAKAAQEKGIPVYILAGSIEEGVEKRIPHGACRQISPPDLPLEKALAATADNLRKAIANLDIAETRD